MIRRSVQGYAEQADSLAEKYEALTFPEVHPDLILPRAPACVLEIGSGTGRDAAYLARHGHHVLAVEPVAEMRAISQRLHPEPVVWLDDALPEMVWVSGTFDLILITAVWMHLDREERSRSMQRVAGFLAPRGQLKLSLRHRPVPENRVMYDVRAPETISLAQACGLSLVSQSEYDSVQIANRAAGWTLLVFRR